MATQICNNCHVSKPLTAFRPRVKTSAGGKKGELNAICGVCCDQRDTSRKARKRKAADEAAPASDGEAAGDGSQNTEVDLGEMSVGGFLDAVREMDAPVTVRARVTAEDVAPMSASPQTRADQLAAAIGKVQCLHWRYGNISSKELSRTLLTWTGVAVKTGRSAAGPIKRYSPTAVHNQQTARRKPKLRREQNTETPAGCRGSNAGDGYILRSAL